MDDVGIINDNNGVVLKSFSNVGAMIQVAFGGQQMFHAHADLAADGKGSFFLIENTDDAEIEHKLLNQKFQNIIVDLLQVFPGGHHPGCLIKHAQLFPVFGAAEGDVAEDIENIFHFAAPGGQVVLDNYSGRCRAHGAGQGFFGKSFEGWDFMVGQAAAVIDHSVLEKVTYGGIGSFFADKFGHKLYKFDNCRCFAENFALVFKCKCLGIEDELAALIFFSLVQSADKRDENEGTDIEEEAPEKGVRVFVETLQAEQAFRFKKMEAP